MDIHSGARTCPASRALMVQRRAEGWTKVAIAEAAGVSEQTVYKWLKRYDEEGPEGLQDRSSRPHRSPRQTPPERRKLVLELRRTRMCGRDVANQLNMPRSTVARIIKRAGLSRARDLEPREPVVRYERERPGELVHLDIKKLGRFKQPGHRVTGNRTGQSSGRGIGWEYVHVAIDDATRLAYAEVLADEKAPTAASFLARAAEYFADHGILRIERVMTDNGACYRSRLFRAGVLQLGARHIFTRPYRPQTNGKAERFIQTLFREWAYRRPYQTSGHRRRALAGFLRRYNYRRGHGSLSDEPPLLWLLNKVLERHI